jgi:hypothetical protein
MHERRGFTVPIAVYFVLSGQQTSQRLKMPRVQSRNGHAPQGSTSSQSVWCCLALPVRSRNALILKMWPHPAV